MSEKLARILLDSRNSLDRIWLGQPKLPIYLRTTMMIVDYALVKCLQEGGWDIYVNPETDHCDIQRRPK